MTQTLIPAQHLKNAAAKPVPKLLLVGDSIATPTPGTTFDDSASLWGLLRREFAIQNPGRTPIWANRAIGGARWDHLSDNKFATLDATGLGANIPDWPGIDSSTDSWMDALVAETPDAIFFNFGMNDRDIFVEANFADVIADLGLRLPNTDLIFITNMVPHFYSTNSGIGGTDNQNGRLFVQERQRSFARYHGYGMIDMGRAQCRAVAGFDPDRTYLTRAADAASVSTPYTMPMTDRDFGILIDMPIGGTTWDTRLRVDLSSQEANASSWLEIYRDAGGNLAVEYAVLDNAPGRYRTVVSGVAAPSSGTLTLSIFVQGAWASIEAGGALVDEGLIQRCGGRFSPVVSFLDDRVQAITVTPYTARFAKASSGLTFTEFFGSTNVVAGIEGGNDLNHPTARGWGVVFAEALKDVDFHLPSLIALNGVLRVSGVVPPIDDDDTYTLTAPAEVGTLFLWSENTGTSAMIAFVATSSPAVQHSVLGSNTELATPGTELTGTTGTDGSLTVSVKEGEIEIENRRGVVALGSLRYAFVAPEAE